MNLKAILAGGPAAILALGGGVMYAQHELHYLLRPSVVETLAGVAAVGGGIAWSMGKGKRKAKAAEQAPAPQVLVQGQEPQALPQGQPTAAEAQAYLQGMREALLAKQAEPAEPQARVIDLGRAN